MRLVKRYNGEPLLRSPTGDRDMNLCVFLFMSFGFKLTFFFFEKGGGLRRREKPSFLPEKNLLIKKKVFPPPFKLLSSL